MANFKSRKKFDGFSTCFRQWRANTTHCQYLHGYDVEFEVTFEGELDHRNWVWDFGGMKRASNLIDGMQPKAWMEYMFDHTVVVAEDDPDMQNFIDMDSRGIIQLRVVPGVGAEKFAEFLYHKLNDFVQLETEGRVKVVKVKFMENHKNSAIYGA
jgi:6-pyruvoyltetrahydropterin/6-carboxytetrahydropterin synthase